MKKLLVATIALAISAPVPGIAGEHPRGGQEHPKGTSEHPKKEKKPTKKWVQHKMTMKAFVDAVEGYVADMEKEMGSFEIYDEALDKTWKLNLVRIHKKRIARLGKTKFFACADFVTVGKGKKTEIDLDFFVSKSEEGWNVDEVLVHKVSGKPRYTYNDKGERVSVKSREGKRAQKKRSLQGQGAPSGRRASQIKFRSRV